MRKKIEDILENVKIKNITGNTDTEILGLSFDSRNIKKGYLFFAIDGINTNGHKYIDIAISSGAVAVVCEKKQPANNNVCFIYVDNSAETLGFIASNFYDNPSQKLKLIGVTGTNGKTTIASLLYRLFLSFGYKVGLLSTIKNYINNREISAKYTTPDALTFNCLLNEMVLESCEYCFVEVSSHAVAQKRISGLHFSGGIFTNITHDHLDYHKTFREYLNVKKSFFDNLPKNAFALTNIDDKNGKIILQNTKARKYTYSLRNFADFNLKIIENHLDGMLLEIKNKEVWTLLTGSFNAYNFLSVYAAGRILGFEKEELLTKLSAVKPVAGRFETVKKNGITAIIDYAHTPDALKNVLKTINEIRTCDQKLISVVGAGGDRDKAKRPEMAKISVALSNKVILTSDNPRTENPDKIIKDMYEGIEPENYGKILKITNRETAIKTAVLLANENDIILIAGKGHENYQEINGVRKHFDDKEKIIELLN